MIMAFGTIGFMIGGLMGAPWVPTRRRDMEHILDDTKLKKGELFIELGCGDGRLLAAASRRGARAIGYEINPVMWLVATLRNIRYYPRVRVRLGNFWHRELGDADAVMAFLMPRFMTKLQSKAKTEMRSGARLVSYIYRLPTKQPEHKGRCWFVYKY